jgi:MFS family permease
VDETNAPGAGTSRLALVLDFVSDLGVLAFATWTLIAYGGMVTEAKATLLVAVWLVTVPLLAVLLVLLRRRARDEDLSTEEPERREPPTGRRRRLLVVAAAAGAAASVLLVGLAENALWALVWIGAFVAIAAAVAMGRLRSRAVERPLVAVAWPAHAFAVAAGFVFAVMSLFVSRASGDDTFYVNRATGVAELNRIPVRDIIFTHEDVPPLSGTGLPVDTFSALQGALGAFLNVHGASIAYFVTPPLMTFFATWALWRLLRSWAPRHLLLCFALGCVYWLFSAQGQLTPGSYFLSRMWQGKVILVAWLIPTAYVLMTRWLARRDAGTGVLLVAVGVGSIGLTSSAAFVMPLVFGAAAVPLVAARAWRALPLLMAAGTFPLVVGFAAAQKYSLGEPFQLAEKLTRQRGAPRGTFWSIGTSGYFHSVVGVGLLAAIGLLALLAAPWLARQGFATRMTTGIAVVTILVLAPGVLRTINHVTDLSTLLRRVFWVVPFPAVVGLLAAVPVLELSRRLARASPARRLAAVAAPAVLVGALLIAFGHPLWSSWRLEKSLWAKKVAWKTSPSALGSARAILSHYDGHATILVEERVMHAIALVTVDPKAVNPRSFYARLMPEAHDRIRDRLALTRFVEEEGPLPSRARVESALSNLQVGLVCIEKTRVAVIREVEDIGYREAFPLNRLVCLRRPPPV